MTKFKYSITELLKIDGFEALDAVKNFDGYQDYYDKLTEFTKKARDYLRDYTPSLIIYSRETERIFLTELETVRKTLVSLGAISLAAELTMLNKAVNKKDEAMLADELVNFYDKMEVLIKQLASSRVSEIGGTAANVTEQPVIFAVDDKPEILTTISSILKDHYKVIAITNGKAALKAMESYSPALFLLDIEMPLISGYELAKEIRSKEQFKNTPILFLTGQASRDAVITAVAHGGNDYILKPVDKKTLLDKIKLNLVKTLSIEL